MYPSRSWAGTAREDTAGEDTEASMRHHFPYVTVLLAVCLTIVNGAARAAEPEWSAGVGSAKITPQKRVALAGYASRTKPFEKVDQDLYARALALQDAQGHR